MIVISKEKLITHINKRINDVNESLKNWLLKFAKGEHLTEVKDTLEYLLKEIESGKFDIEKKD